ncbi:MAG: hypothetical protein AAB834_03480 [Patescibacteria group bacterium]
MKVCIAGSMQYAQKMFEISKELRKRGHIPIASKFLDSYLGDKTDEEREAIKLDHKYNHDAIREFWKPMRDGADAILLLNYDKHGIKNYIGGNSFLEMGFAHVLEMKIFLMNPIPDMPYYGTEIIAMNPVVINGDLDKIA